MENQAAGMPPIGFEQHPAPLPDDVHIHPALNGWVITNGRPPAIVVEKVEGRDNMACLLTQIAAMLGDKDACAPRS